MYDNCDLFDEAFHHYQQGNLLKHESIGFNRAKTERDVDEIINAFTRDFFAENKLQGSASELPVFIVGLSRSGKTLTDKLIANHQQVIQGGELLKLIRLINVDLKIKLKKKEKFPSYINEIDNKNMLEVVQEYEKVLLNLGADTNSRVLNTLPGNVFYLGMIAIMFPQSRIIYCKRETLDNCLAIYFKNFGKGNEYAFDLQDIGFYYRLYERLMDHWQAFLPLQIHEIHYEELVARPRESAEILIDFLGLGRDAEWPAFWDSINGDEENKPSLPILHDRFIGRAQKYRKFLAPLVESLKLHAE
jgi:hypothetical protein